MASTQELDSQRPLANFPPSLWSVDSFTSFSVDHQTREAYARQIHEMKEQVRRMLKEVSCNNDKSKTAKSMSLINTLECLGISYHFEMEIEDALKDIFLANSIFEHSYDLYTVALHFRIFRQHGYNISFDIFNRFTDSNGKFKEALTVDVKGMLSLYEATYLRIHDEAVLDEAFAFTKSHLQEYTSSPNAMADPFLSNQVKHALKQALHRGIPRVEARYYISVYDNDPAKNQLLLDFAKIDFNFVQLLHNEELCHISRWWNGLNFERKLPYARNRLVECYLWSVSTHYEPRYALDRIFYTKLLTLFSVTDDTSDAYSTLDELKLFTDAVQRWDMSAIDELPDYMKILYKTLLDTYQEVEKTLLEEGRTPRGVIYSREAFQEIVRCYVTEATWIHEKYVPPFEEYMRNSLVTSTIFMLAMTSFMSMGELASVEVLQWAKSKPKILVASSAVGRLMDDIMTHEEEKKRGIVQSGIECYMRDHRVGKKEAIEELYKMIENYWKDINGECLKLIDELPMPVIVRCINLTRTSDVTYKDRDGYTYPEEVYKPHILSLFLQPVII